MPIGHTMICLLGALLMVLARYRAGRGRARRNGGNRVFPGPGHPAGFVPFLPAASRRQRPGFGAWDPAAKRSADPVSTRTPTRGSPTYSPQTRCQKCHIPQTKDLHGLRMDITCVQCHRSQPVAGVYHYYSPLNPIRRHAYVCAKCHEGATPSFASYMVHEPNPLASEARESIPAALLRRLVHVDPGGRGVRDLPALYRSVVAARVCRQDEGEMRSWLRTHPPEAIFTGAPAVAPGAGRSSS